MLWKIYLVIVAMLAIISLVRACFKHQFKSLTL